MSQIAQAVLLVFLWYAVALEFHFAGTMAVIVALLIVFGGWLLRWVSGKIASVLGPRMPVLLLHAAAWLALVGWSAPPVLVAQPMLTLFGAIVLVIAGARCRTLFERERLASGPFVWSDHSGAVVGVMLAGSFLCMVALLHWHSLWPLIGYTLLPGLPLMLGWREGPMPSRARANATSGDADASPDEGVSDEC